MKNNNMKSYIPPHKRNNNNKVDNFDEPWLSVKNKKRDNLKNANFPSLNKNKDTQDNSLSKESNIYNYKSVTELFKKKRELRNKKKNDLPPGWIKLNKESKYEKMETEIEMYYKQQIIEERIKKFLNKQEEYYRNYEELTGEDIRYYISESESEEEFDYDSESVSEEETADEFYDEQDIYLKKYNRN
tara:strand:- start:2131 stop:2691 length:561 start_codon:yes stop_codon:yes gene_type:complete